MEEIKYVADMSFHQFLDRTTTAHPELARMIDRGKTEHVSAYLQRMNEGSWEFEDGEHGGRGTEYNVAQKVAENRAEGMTNLLRLFSVCGNEVPGEECVILDALAGDGTVSRFADTLPARPTLISADLSAYMIAQCMEQNLPCIRQSAAFSLLHDNVLDGVLIAYGSHHLSSAERRQAAAEARRTLKPGGRFVLHDFETGGAVDAWFRDVVHPSSLTGHPHPHFSRAEMAELLESAGLQDRRVFEMPDPFTLSGATRAAAREHMLRHLYNMYGLVKLPLDDAKDLDALEARVSATLGDLQMTQQEDGTWLARLERNALIAFGVK